MIFKKEEAYQHALCMDLTPDKFTFSIVNIEKRIILLKEEFKLENFDRDGVEHLLKHKLLSHDFGNFILSSGSVRNTLLPVDLFSYSKPEEVFRLNYPAPIDNLDYNRIAELGIVNIYELPLWIKSLFVVKFPRIKIVHRSTVLLKGVFDQPTFSPKINLFIEEEQFYLILTERSKLTYFNRFDYKELADLVYYILFVLEQKELDQEKFEINLFGVNMDWDQLSNFKDFFTAKVKISEQREKAEGFILEKQLLCV